MPADPPKQRLLRLLRRTTKTTRAPAGGRSTADVSALWSAHERALVRALTQWATERELWVVLDEAQTSGSRAARDVKVLR